MDTMAAGWEQGNCILYCLPTVNVVVGSGIFSAPHEHASIESREKKIHGPKGLILAVANCNKTNIFKAPSRPYSSKQTRVKMTEI